MRQLRLLSVAVALSLTVAGCGGRKEPDTLLGYVPADSPYVFANIDPTPKELVDVYATKMAPVAGMYEDMIKDALAKLATEPADDPAVAVVKALLEELQGKISMAGMESMGFSAQSHVAMYGIGLVPVMRVELKDPAAFQAFLGRVEKRAGQPLLSFKVGDQSYWRVGKEGKELAGLMAIADGDLVLSLMPAKPSNELLERLLGITLPDESLADAHKLQDLNKQFGYMPYGSGYIDVVRVMQSIVEEKSGIEKEFLSAFGEKDELPSAECKTELLGIAANMPRFAFGYTKLDGQQIDSHGVLELKPELAKPLSALPAAVPGLGTASASVFDFGFSLDVQKMVDFANAQANAVAAAPFKCPELVKLNDSFAELRTSMANPGLMMAAPALKGARAVVTKFEMPEGAMPVVGGKILIASDNPQSLVALAKNFAPQIAALDLKPNAPPQPLPAELAPPGTPTTHVAMTDKTLGLAVGDGEEASMAAFLNAAPGNPPPLFTFGYGGSFFATIAQAGMMGMADKPAEERAEAERTMKLLQDLYGRSVDHLDFAVLLTERGVEVRQSMKFK
ncbi:MAG TPA: hypothetical protein VFL14_03490 [Xanthomonadales bacterium]|nr:hypothetical protein [Xanthomonadales bacterium]